MIILIILGFIFAAIGLIGCIIPGLAGPPFSFTALLILQLARHGEPFRASFLLGMAGLTLAVTLLDYAVPAMGAKRYGASRTGFWGAFLGMILGIFAAPPLGIILGAFFGAFIGELIAGKAGEEAARAGMGVFIGILFGMLSKLLASGIMTYYFIKAVF